MLEVPSFYEEMKNNVSFKQEETQQHNQLNTHTAVSNVNINKFLN